MSQKVFDANRTPIIKLWDVLLVPLQGDVTDRQAQQLTDEVLERIHHTGVRGMVIDLSGMWMVDSHLCAVLARLSSSAKLMGTRTVISGMSPDVALTLQSLGVRMSGLESTLGLEEAMELLPGGRPAGRPEDGSEQLLDALLDESKVPTGPRKENA